MKKMLGIVMFAGTSFLQACSTSYVQPEGTDVAFLTIKNPLDGQLEVAGFRNAADCSGGLIYLAPDRYVQPRGELQIKVRPDEPFSFYASYSLGGEDCRLTATFTPKAGSHYAAYYSLEPSEGNCFMSILVQTTSAEVRESSFRLRRSQTPTTPSGSFCR